MTLIKLLVEGGNMTPGPAVAQQLGPTGVDIGRVISDVNVATSKFTGITLPVHLTINPSTKQVSIKVLSPPTSELIKKELNLKKASGARLKQRVGNFAIEQVIAVAKQKHDAMLSNDFISTVKTVLGTCQALGVMVENKEVKEIMKNIEQYSKEIDAKKTDVDSSKREELDNYFATIAAKQESLKKAEDAEKSATEAKKAKKSAKK